MIEKHKQTSLSLVHDIQEHMCLADKNWFATGGNARYFATSIDAQSFSDLILWAQKNNLSMFVLGSGANLLFADTGFQGLVIKPENTTIVHKKSNQHILVTAGAGVLIDGLIEYCLEHCIRGLEEFSGIPGTIGGSVFINLHYFQFLLSDFLISARVIHTQTGAIETVDTNWFKFGYDDSRLHKKEYYLIDATFKLNHATDLEIAYARGRRAEIIRHRYNRYPYKNTCGSFFRNFHDHEVTLTINGKKMIYVAYYLDKLGIKGELSSGAARVSHQHANMIVHDGTATSSDIISLACMMQKKVYDTFGIIAQPECQLVGFDEYPLMNPSIHSTSL